MKSDTPRTDAFEALLDRPSNWWDLARELERENARLQMELDASCNAEEMRQVRAENATLRAAVDQQANYQRELRADRDRLDALQRNKWLVQWTGHNWYVCSPKGKYFPDIRQAIDAAREAQP
jgi:hypothetical protein